MSRCTVILVRATQIWDEPIRADDSKERLNEVIFRELMDARGIASVAELARRSKVSKATIFRLIAGEAGASLRVARNLAGALGTTVDTLFARSER